MSVSKKVIVWAFICSVVFWVADKISLSVRTAFQSGAQVFSQDFDLLGLITSPFSSLDRLVEFSTHKTDLLVAGVAVLVVGMIVLYRMANRKEFRPGEEHGSASWGKRSDISSVMDKDPRANLWLSKTEGIGLDGRKTQRNLNVLVIGSSGSGKSRYYVEPNLANANMSYVITDPKGALLDEMGEHLVKNGYEIRCLNLVDFARSDTFNPLAYFEPDTAEINVSMLVENFIANTSGQKPSNANDFWEKAERALLNALVAYVYFRDPDEGTLLDVLDLIHEMSASEQDENHLSDTDATFLALEELLADFDNDPDSFDEDAKAMLKGMHFAWSQYSIYTKGAGETKKSIIISLGVRMAPLEMSAIKRILGSNTIEADSVGRQRTALFLILPDTHMTFSFLAAIFYQVLTEKLVYIADHSPGHQLAVQTHMFMDEFANIGKMPSFEKKIAVIRSRGLSVSVILQAFSQGKAMYKDDWDTIVGNCDSLLFLGGTETSTTEWISKRLGKATITSHESSQQKGLNGHYTVSERSLGRELLTPDEVGLLPHDECLVLIRGLRPFKSKKQPATTHTSTYTYTPQ